VPARVARMSSRLRHRAPFGQIACHEGCAPARQSPTQFENSSGTSARLRTVPGSCPG
jgi:hypothetical protein